MIEPEPVTTVDVLRDARARIADPDRWTKGTMARDSLGEPTPIGPCARQWCALGACQAAGGPWRAALYALETAARRGCNFRITAFNDHPGTTHADVLALYDAAIPLAELWAVEAAEAMAAA